MNKKLKIILIITVLVVLVGVIIWFLPKKDIDYVVIPDGYSSYESKIISNYTEYIEFVNILKLYVKSETEYTQTDHLHLIYKDKTSTIIDDNKNIINCNENLKKAKYVSDISFSSNDYALNTLLNLVPRKITIHLIDGYTDEFINTLKLIFQDKVQICEDCDICLFYKANSRPVSTDLHF